MPRVLNMAKSRTWQGSQYANVTQGSKYAKIWLNMSDQDVNMPNISEFTTIDRVLNMLHTVYSVRSLCLLMSTYWEVGVLIALSKIYDRGLWKNNYRVNYFRKILFLKSLRKFWICVGFYICQGSEYSRIVNLNSEFEFEFWFWISRVTQGLPNFMTIAGFWICARMQLWKGSVNSRILDIPDLAYASVTQISESAWIWLKNTWINCSYCGKVLYIPGQSFTEFSICLRF